MKLYGAKCHLCTHLTGPAHNVPEVWPVPDDDCPTCSFCQEAAFYGSLIRSVGERIFSPEVRAALEAFRQDKPHPLIDQLRAEMQQIERGRDAASAAFQPHRGPEVRRGPYTDHSDGSGGGGE